MRNIGQLVVLVSLFAVGFAAVGQVSISILNGKPEKPVVGLPFIADQSVRNVLHLANGMAVTREIKGHIYRSTEGMERYEGTVVSTDPANPSPAMQVFILDRVKRTTVLLNTKLMTATVQHLPTDATVTISFLALQVPAQYRTIKAEDVTTTDLGKQTQDMMELLGKRTTGTIPAGKIGNDQPLQVIAEEWVSQQEKLVVKKVEQNPLSGERTFELTNIRNEEPDPALFEIPKGYTVKEQTPLPNTMAPFPIKESAPPNVANTVARNGDPRADAQTTTPATAPASTGSMAQAAVPSPVLAQAPAAAPPPAYADEPLVIERLETVVEVAADGTGWRERTLVARLQSDTGVKRYSVLNISYAGNSQHVEIAYARVTHADGTVVETPPTEAMDMPAAVTRAAPFYSDLKELQLPVRSLRVGDRFEMKYRIVRTKAETPGEFWGQESFSETAVTLEQTLELRLPAGMYVQVWSPTMKPAESSTADDGAAPAQHIYRWSAPQLKPTVGKEAEAALATQKKVLWTPEQELDAEQGKLPTAAWTTFKSWEEVGAWYRGLEADRIVADDTAKAKVAELIKGKTTDEEKARALYDYVATNIRYIGVAFGIGRYQPHAAAEILSNQYGDCKDKHTLLAAMLAAAGIQSDAVLIGAGVRYNEAVPSPASFNHLITRAAIAGKPVWLDTTAEVAPWNMLVLVTRDKQALVIPASGLATIAHTPVDPPFPNVETMDSVGSLGADGVSTSHIAIAFGGDGEIAARTLFRMVPPDKYDAVAQLFAKTMGFAGTTSNPEVTRPTDMTQPFKFSFDYKREKAGDWEHLRTLPEVVPARFPQVTEMEPPVRAIQLGVPQTETSTSAMKLPEGWSAIQPPAVHAKCDYATYDMTYRLENGTVYADRKIVVLAKKVPVSDWRAYKAVVDMVNPGKERYIQLLTDNKTLSGTSGSSASLSLGMPTAVPEQRTKQIEDALKSTDPMVKNNVAYGLAQNGDHLADAQLLVEQALPLREQQTADAVSGADPGKAFDQMILLSRFWDTAGYVYYRAHQPEKAEAYLRAAWELNPNSLFAIHLGFVYETEKKQTEAAAVYRMALSSKPAPALLDGLTTHLAKLGYSDAQAIPVDIAIPLPTLNLNLGPDDTEPLVDIALMHNAAPVVTVLKGDSKLKKPLTQAIQPALASSLPDSGPEIILRRARVTCSASGPPSCSLHFVTTGEYTTEELVRRRAALSPLH